MVLRGSCVCGLRGGSAVGLLIALGAGGGLALVVVLCGGAFELFHQVAVSGLQGCEVRCQLGVAFSQGVVGRALALGQFGKLLESGEHFGKAGVVGFALSAELVAQGLEARVELGRHALGVGILFKHKRCFDGLGEQGGGVAFASGQRVGSGAVCSSPGQSRSI